MKFSIIVPVYNGEEYIEKCLVSLNNQEYDNYEVIIVNDGSIDNTEKIIKKFIQRKRKFKYFYKPNGGLSDARNYGVINAKGDYLLFVDSDDYVESGLLTELNKELLKCDCDIIKFNFRIINDKVKREMNKVPFIGKNANDSIPLLLKEEFFEPAWLFCYKKSFWLKHKFQFSKGRIHEDFGLTPLIIMCAKKISNIDYVGYNYVVRENSIMTSSDDLKELKKFNDCLFFFDNNIYKIIKCNNINVITKKLLISYYANGIYSKASILAKKNREYAIKEIKRREIHKLMNDDSIMHKTKRLFAHLFPNLYLWVINNEKN